MDLLAKRAPMQSPSHKTMIPRSEALEIVTRLRTEQLSAKSTTSVSVRDSAGKILGESIDAPVTSPERNYATMDGFAFDATDAYPLRLLDRQVFPEDNPDPIESGEAVRIATGAPLPEGANAVLKREDATIEEDDVDSGDKATSKPKLSGLEITPGTYTYERGSNMTAGQSLFTRGETLSARDTILLGDIGRTTVEVIEPFSVGFLATGTEIHEGTRTDLDSPMLASLVSQWGHNAGRIDSVSDELDQVTAGISAFAEEYDVVVTTGGTSVGKKDYVIRALAELGEVEFHCVLLRPGKPIAVARLPDHDAVAFAIPGKPVGAYTVATLVMRAFFTGEVIPGQTMELEVDRAVGIGKTGFEYAIPVSINSDGETVRPFGHVDSDLRVYGSVFDPSVLSSTTRATRADGFFITESGVDAGEMVSVYPYSALE